MKQQSPIVQPLGKYGHAYELSKTTYGLYLAWSIILYSWLILLVIARYIYPAICVNILDWLCKIPPASILITAFVGVFCQVRIAAYGDALSSEQAKELLSRKKGTFQLLLYNIYWLAASIASVVLSVILLISMHTRWTLDKPIPTWGYLLLVMCLYIPFHCYKKWRENSEDTKVLPED